MRKKDKPDDRKTPEAVAERLRAFYSSRYANQHQRNIISRRLFALTDQAGIAEARKTPRGERHKLYPRAVAAAGEHIEAYRLRYELDHFEAEIEELRKEVEGEGAKPGAQQPDAPKKEPRCLFHLNVINDRLRLLGLVRGDKCKVYEIDDLAPGDAVALEIKDKNYAAGGRVVSLDAEQITIRDDNGDESYSRAEIKRAGRLDYLNPTKIDPLTKEQRARVDRLREELEKLGAEDDQIIRCSQRYKLEKEIFDLEHPVDVGGWSAWEEGGES